MENSVDQLTRVDYIPKKGYWMVNVPLSYGSAVVDPRGIVRILAKAHPIDPIA